MPGPVLGNGDTAAALNRQGSWPHLAVCIRDPGLQCPNQEKGLFLSHEKARGSILGVCNAPGSFSFCLSRLSLWLSFPGPQKKISTTWKNIF